MISLSYTRRDKIKSLPGLLPIYYRLFRHKFRFQLVGPYTRICLEGFPRSGNSYALSCVQSAFSLTCEVAHHTHSIVNVRRAVQREIPAFVLIRDPIECSTSLVVGGFARSLNDALTGYLRFHSGLLTLLDKTTVLPFESLIEDPSRLLELVAKALRRDVSSSLDEAINAAYSNLLKESESISTHRLGHPHPKKEALKKIIREQQEPSVRNILKDCEALRDTILSSPANRA